VRELVTAGAGFLLAVLWFDLMFDVQVLRRRGREVPETALESIAAYYRRVTTDARPMNLLVGAAMVATLAAIVAQIAAGDDPKWVAWRSLVLAGGAIALAVAHTFRTRGGSALVPTHLTSKGDSRGRFSVTTWCVSRRSPRCWCFSWHLLSRRRPTLALGRVVARPQQLCKNRRTGRVFPRRLGSA
jgi:di/tricarboxylate transporter